MSAAVIGRGWIRLGFLRLAPRWQILLLSIGIASEAVYLIFAFRFPLLVFYPYPSQDLAKLAGRQLGEYGLYLGLIVLAILLFCVGYLVLRRIVSRASAAIVAAFGFGFHATLFLMYPVMAADVFDYVAFNRLFARFGVNPYVVPPAAPEYADAVFAQYTGWPGWTSPYGPLWHLIAAPTAMLARRDLLFNLLLSKGLLIIASLATAALIYLVLRRVAPHRATIGLYLWAWNPLVVFEIAGNAHNGVVMLLFIALALALRVYGLRWLVLPATLLAGLVKWPALILFPVFVFFLLREGPTRVKGVVQVVGSGLLALLLGLLVYWPFLPGPSPLDVISRNSDFFTSSLPGLALLSLQGSLRSTPTMDLVQMIALAVFAVACGLRLLWAHKAREDVIAVSFDVIFLYLLLASFWVMPWYFVWLVPFAALAPEPWRVAQMIALALSATLWYLTGFLFFHVFAYSEVRYEIAATLAAFGPVLLVTLAWALWRFRGIMSTRVRAATLSQLLFQE